MEQHSISIIIWGDTMTKSGKARNTSKQWLRAFSWLRHLKNVKFLSAWYIDVYLFVSPKIGWHEAKIISNDHQGISVEKLLEMTKNVVTIQIIPSKKHADCHQCNADEQSSWNSILFQLLFGVTRWRSQEKDGWKKQIIGLGITMISKE